MDTKYQFSYSYDNLYGHAVELIKKYSVGEICLDIGCGWGAIAEPLTQESGLKYIGIDENNDAIANLKERGFESYCYSFQGNDADLDFLKSIVGERSLASVCALDILEHVYIPDQLLTTIRSLAIKYSSPLILSVPNFTHRDIAMKLLCGKLDILPTGILDETHKNIYSEEYLTKIMEKNGWYQINCNDYFANHSDQYFPEGLTTLAEGTLINQVLTSIRETSRTNGTTEQFLRAYLPGNKRKIKDDKPKTPFLSVILRTQGYRPETLKEALLCLTGQTCTDFEVLVVGHKLDLERQLLIERIIADTPKWIREKIKLIRLADGNRAKPLNYGFEQALGEYVACYDDDDLIFSNWVEAIKKTAKYNNGKIIRSYCLKQNCGYVKTIYSNKTVAAMGTMEKCYIEPFDYLSHLYQNKSPFMCLAFPRSIYSDLGYRFDESLTTTEDWDFLLRTAQLCGVVDSGEITCVYRWWLRDDSSKTQHDEKEWKYNKETILRKLNKQHFILPAGSVNKIRDRIVEVEQLKDAVYRYSTNQIENERVNVKRKELYNILLSNTMWLTRFPYHIHNFIFRKSGLPMPDIFTASEAQIDYLIAAITQSRRWRWTAWLRKK
jgi:glycosyltransferase involved in cell wall biosynthesis/2-polyprenyl-3-methyl-5-hydroxy-6-metoxy-1,4-benzoquinol methylase